MYRLTLILALVVIAGCTTPNSASSPYIGQEYREIKALSPSEISGLLGGKGMGYAKAAELNGYPGPAHVLELAVALQLSAEQRAKTDEIFSRMQSSAKSLGRELIEAERALEKDFRSRAITAQSLLPSLDRVARVEARLRNAHLQAHIEQTALLSTEQIARYKKLRGYGGASTHQNHGKHKH